MSRPAAELRAEMDRWKSRQLECRLAARTARVKSERRDSSIEAAYAAVIVGALAYALGETSSPAVRVKVE